MGIINSQTYILKAILTKRGREIMFANNEKFNITKWAVGDEEINYNTFDTTVFNSLDTTPLDSPVFEPSVNGDSILQHKLLRTVPNYADYMADVVAPQQIPSGEYAITYVKKGSDKFTLENFLNESMQFSFALTLNHSNTLSENFIIDMSNFCKYNNTYFDIQAQSPVGFLTTQTLTSNYWYVVDQTNYILDGAVRPVIVGLSSRFRNPNTPTLDQFVNDFNASVIVFSLELPKDSAIRLFNYFHNNNISSITDKIIIQNADINVIPKTNFFGVGSSYKSIATTINITISI